MRHMCRRVRSHRWLVLAIVVALLGTGGGVPFSRPTVKAQAPVGADFTLDAGDLRFIFRQIQIAQDHATRFATNGNASPFGPGANQVNEVRLPFGLRTVDGSFNHLNSGQTKFGAADQRFPRLTTRVFRSTPNYDQTAGEPRRHRPGAADHQQPDHRPDSG